MVTESAFLNHASAYRLYEPESLTAPFLFAVPHAGRDYPADLHPRSDLSTLALRSAEDAFIDELYNFIPALGAPLLVATVARAYVDLNRAADELDPTLFAWDTPTHACRHTHRVSAGLGVIPRVVANSEPIYDRLLDPAEITHRLSGVYDPYHRAVLTLLEKIRARFGYAVLVDCHSMPSLAMPSLAALPESNQTAVVIGDQWGTTADQRLSDHLERLFRCRGYKTRRNMPYAGGYTTTRYGKPRQHVHALQIEVSRPLYMEEKTLVCHHGFARLQADLQAMMSDFIGASAPGNLVAE